MKRILSLLISLLLCVSAFAGCGDLSDSHGNPSDIDAIPDLANASFSFNTYDEMLSAFLTYDTNKSSYTIQDYKLNLGEAYTSFLEKIEADRSIPQPMLDNKPITYRNKEGFSNITFFVNELYSLPWIWYFPSVSTGENFYIGVAYLPDSIIEKQKNMTASKVIKELSPNSANIDNLGNQHKRIYNKQMKLNDREVAALVIEYKEDTRDNIFFVYDGLLVLVRCDSGVWSEQWFSSLSFKTIKQFGGVA